LPQINTDLHRFTQIRYVASPRCHCERSEAILSHISPRGRLPRRSAPRKDTLEIAVHIITAIIKICANLCKSVANKNLCSSVCRRHLCPSVLNSFSLDSCVVSHLTSTSQVEYLGIKRGLFRKVLKVNC